MRLMPVIAFALALTACDGGEEDPVEAILALSGDATAGETVYNDNCAACHDSDSYPDLSETTHSDEHIAEIVLYGEGSMVGFEGELADQEIADVIAYIGSL